MTPLNEPTTESATSINTESEHPEPEAAVTNTETATATSSVTTVVPEPPPPQRHSMTTRSNNIIKPATRYNLNINLHDRHWIPTTWQQAMKHPKWRAAMLAEFNSQVQNHTWDLEKACNGMNVVGCHWIFTIKYHPNGEIDDTNLDSLRRANINNQVLTTQTHSVWSSNQRP